MPIDVLDWERAVFDSSPSIKINKMQYSDAWGLSFASSTPTLITCLFPSPLPTSLANKLPHEWVPASLEPVSKSTPPKCNSEGRSSEPANRILHPCHQEPVIGT